MGEYQTRHGLIRISGDSRMENKLRDSGEYMYKDISVCTPYIHGVVVDVGAHVGLWTIPLSHLAEKVIAIEANPETAKELRYNLEKNGVKNVVVHQVLLGDPEKKYRRASVDAPTGENYYLEGGEQNSVTVDMLVDEVVDFMKIDVEGMEPEVLMGTRRIIEESKPVIFIEINPKALRKHGKSIADVVCHLHGYTYYRFDDTWGLIHLPVLVKSFYNLLAIPSDTQQPQSMSFVYFIFYRILEKIGIIKK